jgi:hypothetical protein
LRHVVVHVVAGHLEVAVVEVEAKVGRVDRLHQPGDLVRAIECLADVRLEGDRAAAGGGSAGELAEALDQQVTVGGVGLRGAEAHGDDGHRRAVGGQVGGQVERGIDALDVRCAPRGIGLEQVGVAGDRRQLQVGAG